MSHQRMKTLMAMGRLTRVYTIVVAAIVVYAVAPGADGAWAGVALALTLAGAFAFNDVRDRAADAVNVPTRPIPSGVISATAAGRIAAACSAGAILSALITRSPRVIALTSAMTLMLFAYSIWLKPVLGVKNVVMALVGASVPLFGGLSIEARELALAIGLFILQKEIVADVYDREGDARVRLRTLPVVLGVRGAILVVIAVNVVFIAASAIFLSTAIGAALCGIGAVNVIAAAMMMRICRRSTVLHFLRLQQSFLLAGVLIAWM
jgi:4-hydroxybenzoate polyprenyltransferase